MIPGSLAALIDDLSVLCAANRYYLGVGAGVLGGLIACHGVYCRSYRWQRVGEVSQLYLYPLKSGKALSVDEVECGLLAPSLGGVQDRGFMVVTTRGTGVDLRYRILSGVPGRD